MALSHLDSTLAISIHMLHRNQSSKVAPLSLLAMALLFAPAQADAGGYAALCTSASTACEYTSLDAPALRADVCWNRIDARLKGTGDCPTGSWPYRVDFGEVIDPMLGLIIAYAPLPDACDLGLCVTLPAPASTTAEPLCCDPEHDNCSPSQGPCGAGEEIVWCEQTATNDSGNLSCHDG